MCVCARVCGTGVDGQQALVPHHCCVFLVGGQRDLKGFHSRLSGKAGEWQQARADDDGASLTAVFLPFSISLSSVLLISK